MKKRDIRDRMARHLKTLELAMLDKICDIGRVGHESWQKK